MQYDYLTKLASTYAGYVKRSLMTVAKRAGVHNKTFVLLGQGKGCHVDTYQAAFRWFDANWPADLEWPTDVPRPSAQTPKRKRRAA